MRVILIFNLLFLTLITWGQDLSGINENSNWQFHAFIGQSIASPSINIRVGYPDGAFKSIEEPIQLSYSLGISLKKPLLNNFYLEYGLAWQRYQIKVVYNPVDSSSVWGRVLSENSRYDLLQTSVMARKDFFIGKKFFIISGLGLNFSYVIAATKTTMQRTNVQPQYGEYEFTIAGENPRFNLAYNLYIGFGIKHSKANEISLRFSLQNLFLNEFDKYGRHLGSTGFSIVYGF